MKNMEKIVIAGVGKTATKIEELLSRAGLKIVLWDDEEMANADIILECLPCGTESRKEAFNEWDKKAPPDALLATAASGGVTEIAAAMGRPERVVGLNFVFNPLEEKCLVQIVKGLDTSDETVEACRSLIEKTGATAIVVADAPGLVLDHVMASVINEAAIMFATGVATIEDIDKITRLCLNWPMGPFEFADTIGLDNVLASLESLSQLEGPRFLPCRLIRDMVTMRKLGKKTGRGFYTYGQ